MVNNKELLKYSIELVRLVCLREDLEKKLVRSTADVQDFESNLFKLCVLDFADDVEFLKDKEELTNAITDEVYCEGVYSVVSSGIITFYEETGNPLIRMVLNSNYETVEV